MARRAVVGALLLALALALAPAAAVAARPEGAPPAEDAQAAYDRGDDATAWRIWWQQAQQGDAAAEFGLGLCYDLGRGVSPDPRQALDWYLRAARAGLALAEFNAAVMFDSGTAGPRDAAQAGLWYARAAAHGHARAAFDLAQLYQAGDGVPRNPAVAMAWYRAAAAGGITAARWRTGGPPVSAAALAAPDGEATQVQVADGQASLELIWNAPPQPGRVTYAVEVTALDGAAPHTVFSATTDRSAILAVVPATPGRYAWRADAVSESQQSYRAAAWTDFAIPAAP
jgi:TPR repeat protein